MVARFCYTGLALAALFLLSGSDPAGTTLAPSGSDPGARQARAAVAPAALRVETVATYPHDPQAFTQGLVLDGETLYESTGAPEPHVNASSVRRVEIATGKVLQKVGQAAPIFAEGLAVVGPHLIQLTWKNGLVYQYDKKTFARTKEWGYSGEGWGACYDGKALVTSDGSDRLTLRDAASMTIQRVVHVTVGGRPLNQLNELECVGSDVWANVWMTDRIVRIDAKSGRVTATVDAPNLLTPAERANADVLNGIAWDPASKTFLITGKWWPKMFRVRFVP
jgi:glutaminyl-peptide cyclotransferase